jgi:hypothetical protein
MRFGPLGIELSNSMYIGNVLLKVITSLNGNRLRSKTSHFQLTWPLSILN